MRHVGQPRNFRSERQSAGFTRLHWKDRRPHRVNEGIGVRAFLWQLDNLASIARNPRLPAVLIASVWVSRELLLLAPNLHPAAAPGSNGRDAVKP